MGSERRPVRRGVCGFLQPALLVVTVLVCWRVAPLWGQTVAQDNVLPEDVRAALRGVADFTYDFAQPGYYALLEFAKRTGGVGGPQQLALAVDDWRVLLERPADFRGQLLELEGIVGRNKDPYTHAARPELGPVWQVELRQPGQPLACTVIFTNDVTDLPLGARVRLRGWFVKINRFPASGGKEGLSALIISPGPLMVSTEQAAGQREVVDWRWLLAAVIVGLAVAVYLMWRAGRPTRSGVEQLRTLYESPEDLREELSAWEKSGAEPHQGRAEEGEDPGNQ